MTMSNQTGFGWFAAVLAVALALQAVGSGASAHVKMNKTAPADGATVAPGLTEIRLAFDDAIRMTLVKITKLESKTAVPTTSQLPRKFVTKAKIAVQPLSPGQYKVAWIGVGKDGHVMKGAFSFSVVPKDASRPEDNAR